PASPSPANAQSMNLPWPSLLACEEIAVPLILPVRTALGSAPRPRKRSLGHESEEGRPPLVKPNHPTACQAMHLEAPLPGPFSFPPAPGPDRTCSPPSRDGSGGSPDVDRVCQDPGAKLPVQLGTLEGEAFFLEQATHLVVAEADSGLLGEVLG